MGYLVEGAFSPASSLRANRSVIRSTIGVVHFELTMSFHLFSFLVQNMIAISTSARIATLAVLRFALSILLLDFGGILLVIVVFSWGNISPSPNFLLEAMAPHIAWVVISPLTLHLCRVLTLVQILSLRRGYTLRYSIALRYSVFTK